MTAGEHALEYLAAGFVFLVGPAIVVHYVFKWDDTRIKRNPRRASKRR